jgi:general secretion pathway protein K
MTARKNKLLSCTPSLPKRGRKRCIINLLPRLFNCTDKNTLCSQRGSALIITLLLITVLVGLTVDFVYEVYIDTSSFSNWSNAQKASLMARSGQTLSSLFLKEVNKISHTTENGIELPVERDFGPNAFLLIKLEDENSKFNLNGIIYQNGMANDEELLSLKKLLEYLNINPTLGDVIADWIDPDNEPREGGSEGNSKNSFFWSIDELRLIEEIDDEIYKKITPYITIYGNSRINVNTAPLPVLISMSDDMTEELAQRIIDYRSSTPFEDESHIVRVSGLESIGQRLQGKKVTVKAEIFKVTATAMVNEIKRIIESVMDNSMKILYWKEQ